MVLEISWLRLVSTRFKTKNYGFEEGTLPLCYARALKYLFGSPLCFFLLRGNALSEMVTYAMKPPDRGGGQVDASL